MDRSRWLPVFSTGAILLIVGVTAALWPKPATQPPQPAPTTPQVSTGPPTGPTITPGAGLPKGNVAAGEGGTPGPGGMPIGFEHTPDGAVATTTACSMWVFKPAVDDPTTREALARQCTTDHYYKALLQGFTFGARTHEFYGPNVEMQPQRGAYSVKVINPDQVEVLLWIPVFYPGITDMGSDFSLWQTWAFDLKWANGSWRIDDDKSTSTTNPVPADLWGNPSAAEKARLLTDPSKWAEEHNGVRLSVDRFVTATWMEYSNASR